MSQQLAVVTTGLKRELKAVEKYRPEKGEVLVKNVAVAANPKDWKIPYYIPQWVAVEGNDVAGYVEEVGEGVTGFTKGDKVAGFSEMIKHTRNGAFQQYTIVPSHTLFPLPPETSFEEASTYPLAFMTAAIGLFQKLKLPTPLKPVSAEDKFPILIWGASTSVGAYAVQLAKLSGLEVIGVAGSSTKYAKEIGADEVIDYRGKSPKELAAAFRAALNGRGAQVTRVYDAISEESTLVPIVEFLSANPNPSKITTVLTTEVTLPADGRIEKLNTYVKAVHEDSLEYAGTTLEGEKEFSKQWYAWLGREGKRKIQPNRVRVIPGGLAAVDEGLTLLKDGKVNAEKLVFRIEETKGLL
ncbi:GroES-like protein [Atractiella rhizophila]|nr:GroES-like protein [Atractiella rhizophila]